MPRKTREINSSRFLDEPVTGIKGVGEKSAQLFHRCGVHTVEELLYYYPRDYDEYSEPVGIREAGTGVLCSVKARLVGGIAGRYVRNLHLSAFKIEDEESETCSCTVFNMPYIRNLIRPGVYYVFRGVIQRKGNRLVMDQPAVKGLEEYGKIAGTMQPRYPLVRGLTNNAVIKAVKQAMPGISFIEDILDNEERASLGLEDIRDAIRSVHFPPDRESLIRARNRIAFDELLLFMIKVRALRREDEESVNYYPVRDYDSCDRLIKGLSYELTGDQKSIWDDIRRDLSGAHRMNRLIQGDVGSGKTILAFLALLAVCENGWQGAIMAPTEVLARQHYEKFLELNRSLELPMRPVLLTGSLTKSRKREACEGIADGRYNCVIGTNALIQEKVEYAHLALVVTDEQHRFGVRQRESLAGKGDQAHVLSMSATPIPRTLAVIMYKDMNISRLMSMPGGRIPIKNALVDSSYREKAWNFIAGQVAEGRQAYCICPMIEEGEAQGLENVTEYSGKLAAALPDSVRMGILHGRMTGQEKEKIMEDFAAGSIDVLVSTTVVEVGIDVKNASVMLIENAERFGLAQLHQLRGRVGRGEYQSYCIFINTSETEESKKRLSVMSRSNNGFEIAEEDLKQRGPGELFGIRQSGEAGFVVADIYRDAGLVEKASEFADSLLADDPYLTQERHTALSARVKMTEVTI